MGKIKYRLSAFAAATFLYGLFTVLSNRIYAQYFLRTGSAQNGYLLNFVLQMRAADIEVPENYSIEKIEEISSEYNDSEATASSQNYPDIIVIMDESFADLSHVGETEDDNLYPAPYIKSLTENTTHGYALSSIYGGGTPNSEYEFLTGNSLIFLPEGTYVYSQYIKSPIYNMVNEFNSLGYETVGLHPFYSTGWSRDQVYPLLGFDKEYFLDSFENCDMIRNYVSDQAMFEWITDYYEDHYSSSDGPLFIFGVTIQNHGGYKYSGNNFKETIDLSGYSQNYPTAEQYLSLISETDKAVEYLIDYYKQSERDVLIVFYGDHYPRLDEELYSEIHNGTFKTLDEKQLRYEVPFFIWTNYQSKEQNIDVTSLNYLSTYMLEIAGIPLPPYNQFLRDMQSVIPALNSQGYYSQSKQRFVPLSEAEGDEQKALNNYNILVYNSLFDKENAGSIFGE